MIELTISSAALIIVVLTLRHFLKGRISLRLQYAIWALVLLRLIVPVNLTQSPLSVLNAMGMGETAVTLRDSDPQVSIQEGLLNTSQAKDNTSLALNAVPETNKTTLDLGRILGLVWYTGIAVVGLCLFLSNLSFSRKLRRARIKFTADDYRLKVYVVENLPTPCLYGLFSPAVYITPDVAGDKAKLDHVLAHELCHYRHGDHIWSVLRSLCLAAYWFNPFVWLAAGVSRRDAELACDESTIKRLGEENRMEYGRTLIGLTCQKRSAMDLLCCATAMTESKRSIQERIALIAKKPKTAVYTLAAVLLILAVAVGCTFTGAGPGESAQPAETLSTQTAGSTESPGAAAGSTAAPSPGAAASTPAETANYVGNSGVSVSASAALYTVYDGRKPLSKEELQNATLLTIVNVDSLDFLRDAPNLTHIRTGNNASIEDAEGVSGDIGALAGLTNLESIIFFDSNVTGDIGALRGLEKLQELGLSGTHVSGDISALNNLVSLRVMSLASDSVTGDLSDLGGIPSLESLTLSGSGVTGDLSDLGGLKNLHTLSLISTTNITGNISMVKAMHLGGLEFVETGITIDLSALSGITGLYSLSLKSDNISGNLSDLSGISDLTAIHLSGKKIEGDLSALSGLKNLFSIYLIATPNITGDISMLKGCENLTYITLDETNITAELSAFNDFSRLTLISLSSPGVSGDLGVLSGLKTLKYLILASPGITGDLSALSKLTSLTYIDLSTANVSGDIGALSSLAMLEYLDLSSTGVSGDIGGLDRLSNLRDIDVTDTNVTGNRST
jgi:beta-lactamase regulating signal transducer with metallopeptidase domain